MKEMSSAYVRYLTKQKMNNFNKGGNVGRTLSGSSFNLKHNYSTASVLNRKNNSKIEEGIADTGVKLRGHTRSVALTHYDDNGK